MRVLFVVPYTPNLIRVRPYNLIRYLSERGHQVTVLTLSSTTRDQTDLSELAKHCHHVINFPLSNWRSFWNCLLALPTDKPLQSVFCWQPELAGQLSQLTNGSNGYGPYDIVHIEHLRGARYGLHLNKLFDNSAKQPPVVWDSVDCISSLFRQASVESKSSFSRWITRFELGRTEKYEGWLLTQFSQVLVTSPVDKQALIELAATANQKAEITVLPNGVDLDYFQPDSTVAREPSTIIMSGKMSYHANVTMALHLVNDIMPRVWERKSDVEVMIVGKDPPREVKQLAEHPLINATDTVPDIRPYLQRATIAVAPIKYGTGIQNKVLEAMACATPVIASEQAAEALEATPGKDLLVAEDSGMFVEQILRLLNNPTRRDELGKRGRAYVELRHNWDTIAGKLEKVYLRAGRKVNQI